MFAYGWGWLVLVPIVAIVGSFVTAIVQSLARARVRELEIRERIAMIEKGLVPSPEADPRKFDQFMERLDHYDRVRYRDYPSARHHSPSRYRRVGFILIGVGVGLMLLIGVQSPRQGIGVGGFMACLGLAFFLSSYFDSGRPFDDVRRPDPREIADPPEISDRRS
jgi:Domain of unknown function (DUF6249)